MAGILIVEDSRAQALKLARELQDPPRCHEVSIAHDGRDGMSLAWAGRPDLIVLDLGLPLKDGLEVLRELKAGRSTRNIPVVIATARQGEADQLIGFALGADDYVIKPYSVKVVAARIDLLLSRRQPLSRAEPNSVFEWHGLVLDCYRHRAILHGREIEFTPSEFRLVEVLLRQPGRVFNRNELMDGLVGEDEAIQEKTINVYIRNVRNKLGDAGALIETVRGFGYRLRSGPVNAPIHGQAIQ